MKYLLFAFLTVILVFNIKTETDEMYVVTYKTSHKLFNNWDRSFDEFSILLIHKDQSLYQSLNVMKKDSINVNSNNKLQTGNKYFTFNNYSIKTDKNTIDYQCPIGSEIYHYSEEINFDWIMTSERKKIRGYDCKKATLEYAGRYWVAWYASELPISFGPYKFKGLPGLIIKINDSTNSYNFELDELKVEKLRPLEKISQINKKEFIEVSRTDFNELEYRYNGLSLNEKLNFKKEVKNSKFVQLEIDGQTPMRDVSNSRGNNKSNPIELN